MWTNIARRLTWEEVNEVINNIDAYCESTNLMNALLVDSKGKLTSYLDNISKRLTCNFHVEEVKKGTLVEQVDIDE